MLGRARACSLACLSLFGCADVAWAKQVWPTSHPRALPQPVEVHDALGLRASIDAITWEPTAVVILLVFDRAECGACTAMSFEPAHVFLAYEGLEYAPVWAAGTPEAVEVGQEGGAIELRYDLGRALTGPDARLLVRGWQVEGQPVLAIPGVDVPAMPAGARPR